MQYCICMMFLFLSTALHAINMDPAFYVINRNQETVVIQLEANPTTGYQWFLTNYDHRLLHFNSSQYVPPKKNIMGGAGKMIYNFTVNPQVARPKNTNIQFLYRRPWEPNTGTAKSVMLNFVR